MSYIEENGYFTFDGIKSSDYGVWINGGGTYNAPKRRYKTYEVPGRNGNLTIDEGAFEELEVVYPAFIARDFPSNIEAFRNELMSRNGYVRMTDSYHPGEYYLARYMDGLEADVAPGGVGGAFNLKFMRDPRRFLVDGDTAIPYPPGIESSKNLLKYPYYNTTSTIQGVAWTDLGNGKVTAKGTATANSSFYCTYFTGTTYQFTLEPGEYILTGCPTGGSSSTYRIILDVEVDNNISDVGTDTGEGLAFTVTDSTHLYRVRLRVNSGYTADLLFAPMIQTLYGDNLVPYPYHDVARTDYNGVTYTLDENTRTITTTGSATGNSQFEFIPTAFYYLTLPAGQYRLTGCAPGGSSTTYYIRARKVLPGGGIGTVATDYGEGAYFETEGIEKFGLIMEIKAAAGSSINGLSFKPVLYKLEEHDNTWVPYYDGTKAIVNETPFTARPLIRVTGYGTLTIGSDVVTIASGQTYVDIDSETQDCYTGTTNKNSKVTFQNNDFPTLPPGVTGIAYSGNITQVDVTPRWWRI